MSGGSKGIFASRAQYDTGSIRTVFAIVARGVMDSYRERYHRIYMILLTIVGQWPYQSPKLQRFLQIIFHLNIMSLVTVQGIKVAETWGDVDIMIDCFTPMGVQTMACMKSMNCMMNSQKMKHLHQRMKRDWSSIANEEEIKILEKKNKDGINLFLAYASVLFSAMLIYLLIPLGPQILDIVLPLNESRPLVFLYPTEYFVNAESHYYAIWSHAVFSTVMGMFTIVATDTMYAAYVQHVCGILAIVGYRLERIAENVSSKCDTEPAIEDDVQYHKIIECIKMHRNAIEFAIMIESSYSKVFLIQLGINMLLISVSLLQLLTKLGQYDEMCRLSEFVAASMFHLFFNSWPGQILIDQSVTFRDSVYATGWYTFSLRTRSLLKIVLLCGTSPLKITAGTLWVMSMDNFGQFVQTSISYFTVMASAR